MKKRRKIQTEFWSMVCFRRSCFSLLEVIVVVWDECQQFLGRNLRHMLSCHSFLFIAQSSFCHQGRYKLESPC